MPDPRRIAGMLMQKYIVFLVFVIGVAGTEPALAEDSPKAKLTDHEEATLRASVAGYVTQREAFPFFSCRYTFTSGAAASWEDALAGKFVPDTLITVKCRYAADGGKIALEVIDDPKAFEEAGESLEKARKQGVNTTARVPA